MTTMMSQTPPEVRAAVLAARCAVLLRTIARQGGPEPTEHLEQVRRHLARRGPGGMRTRRDRAASALAAAASGRTGPLPQERAAQLARDLEVIEYVLRQVSRIGANGTLAPA
ncbi:hypothetical protein [Egicoccus sp. AB-alg6-2]|uniref:hypothetical protein n=1 Tax=Egicoccus sp. AB-alg6-2 TaxID=3242692 RepID=UPI00359E9292